MHRITSRPAGSRMHRIGWMRVACTAIAVLAAVPAFGQGQMVGWGSNTYGQTNVVPAPVLKFTQVLAGSLHTIALKMDGTVQCWGSNTYGQCDTPSGLGGVKQVSVGGYHTLALKSDGSVAAWGYDYYGQCVVPATAVGVVRIASGDVHNAVLRGDGQLVCWGDNADGQCTPPSGLAGVSDVICGGYVTMALHADRTLTVWGYAGSGQCNVPVGLTDVVQASGGNLHCAAVRANGTVVCWGDNFDGQSTVPSGLAGVTEVSAGWAHTVALKSDGTVICWGAGTTNTGITPNLGQSIVPAGLSGVRKVSAGFGHTVVQKSDGTVQAWGLNRTGQCNTPTSLLSITRIVGGGDTTAAIRTDGTLFCWGSNVNGQCDVPTGLAGITRVAVGSSHTAALKSDGTVRCWGAGTTNTGSAPNFGQSIVPSQLNSVSSIGVGDYHTIAVRSTGIVTCWGWNVFGQCTVPSGTSGVTQATGGVDWTVALKSAGTVVAWGSGTSGQTSTSSLSGITQVAAGYRHGVALRSNGTVVCWGANNYGSTITPLNLTGVTQVAAGQYHTVALKSDGSVRCWGRIAEGQSTPPSGLYGVSQIACGTNNTLALLDANYSGCSNTLASGSATVVRGGSAWQNVGVWSWAGGLGPQVPGNLSAVDLGTYGSVASECNAKAGTFTARSGSSLLVTAGASAVGNDYSVRVNTTANLAGRVWLLGISGGASTLPADLDLPVLSCATANGFFDLIQTDVPPPAGKFLTLVPSVVNGRTVFSLRLLDLPGNAELTGASTGNFSGTAVAAETIDIDHDGFDDLALAIDFGAGQPGLIQILLNDGAGNLGGSSVLKSIPAQPTCLAVGEVNNDGKADVVVGIASDNSARVYLDNGASALVAGTAITGLGSTPTAVIVLDGTGSSAMPASNSIGVGTSGGKLRIYGDATLQQEVTMAGTPSTVSGGDTKGTGGSTIVTGGTTSNTFGLLPPTETGFVQTLVRGVNGLYAIDQTFGLTAKPVALDVADIDGDGLADIVSANADPVIPESGSALPVLSIFRNNAGSFNGGTPYQPEGASSARSVALIDVDNDGDRDIVSVQNTVGGTEATLLRIDTLGAGTPLSVGQTTVLDSSDPIIVTRGNLDGLGGEDLFLVSQPTRTNFTGFNQVMPFLGVAGLQGDLDGDGVVGTSDIAILLLDFGPCFGTPCPSDLDGDGEVGTGDIAFLLLLFG
ncbi:MAG: FG-GAP-like repeat-containing protein [Planctomycetaceae bacterium]|nr:FG-GAP-like repeat-containing protein [Planctomycetaceae bacterium]